MYVNDIIKKISIFYIRNIFNNFNDNNLAADGPGSSLWGYKKEVDGKTQIIIFSYKTQPTSNKPDEPLQFDCPCKVDWSVFISYPFAVTK